jgi:lipid A 3-O-deacylase
MHARNLAIALTIGMSCAQAQEAPLHTWAGNITFENDLFFGTDRYYTDGVQLELKRRWEVGNKAPGPLLSNLCRLLGCADQPLLVSRYKVGQLMYTPERISVPAPQPDDRPWAGMLYYTGDFSFLSEDQTALTTITGQIGMVGPSSYAEETQKWIHSTFTGEPPLGWHNQIGQEVGVMGMVERRFAVAALSRAPPDHVQFRSVGHWRFAIGNIMTFVGGGMTFTLGKDLAPVGIRGPGVDPKALPLLPGSESTGCLVDWLQCTVAADIEVRWMLRNIFLDGPLFRDGPSIERRPLVADASATLRLDFPRTRNAWTGPWFLQFKATKRSPEFKSTKAVHSQSFGAVTFGTEF